MSAEPLSKVIMGAIIEHAMTIGANGERIARIDSARVLDAFSVISASLIATSPEAASPDGLRRVLRRQARQLESQVGEYRRITADHSTPFVVEVAA